MDYEFRQYQEDCENTLLADVLGTNDCHPVVAIPTGGGKTKILSSFIYKYLDEKPTDRVLVLSHTATIVQQNWEALGSFFPGIHIGLYSSGLGSKTISKITVGGIQSVYRKRKKFTEFDLVIVDECHMIPTKGMGRYRTFFNTVECIRVGLSGSPFRTGHGYVHKGEGALFNHMSYDLCSMENFNQLVADGYLTELYSKPPELQMNVDGITESGGDFKLKELSKRFDRESITKEAIKELLKFGKKYKSWLVFAIDIDHANHINEELNRHGIQSVALHSKSKNDRHEIKDDFVHGRIRAIVSVGMITTGFDAPNIDLLVLLRPTSSPVLHVQMIGRGLRTNPGKTHCLVLDFAGNVSRLGPINAVEVPEPTKKKKKGMGSPIVKDCPRCGCLHHPTVKVCNVCGHKFKFEQKIKTRADEEEVVRTQSPAKWMSVTDVKYNVHTKRGDPTAPKTLKVTYYCGLSTFSEYICYDHNGYAKRIANNWVRHRWKFDVQPRSVQELHDYAKHLHIPMQIKVDMQGKYPRIIDFEF